MVRLDFPDDSAVSVWKMNKLPGVGFLTMIHDDNIKTKLLTTVVDMAKFFAAAWKHPQPPSRERILAVRQECETKLGQLALSSHVTVQVHVNRSRALIDDFVELPWVLTQHDLSSMNLLLDAATGHLQGVGDWADAAIWPCGIGLWGVESILGYDSPNGWTWIDNEVQPYQDLFSATVQQEIVDLSADQLMLIERTRKLGLLLRYGFVWRDGTTVLADNTTTLQAFLEQSIFQK